MSGQSKLSFSILATRSTSSGAQQSINLLDDALKFVFSWVALTPIEIIISGRYFGQLFRLPGRRRQFFQVSIPRVMSIGAQHDEVIFGFSLFFIFLVGIAFADGKGPRPCGSTGAPGRSMEQSAFRASAGTRCSSPSLDATGRSFRGRPPPRIYVSGKIRRRRYDSSGSVTLTHGNSSC